MASADRASPRYELAAFASRCVRRVPPRRHHPGGAAIEPPLPVFTRRRRGRNFFDLLGGEARHAHSRDDGAQPPSTCARRSRLSLFHRNRAESHLLQGGALEVVRGADACRARTRAVVLVTRGGRHSVTVRDSYERCKGGFRLRRVLPDRYGSNPLSARRSCGVASSCKSR